MQATHTTTHLPTLPTTTRLARVRAWLTTREPWMLVTVALLVVALRGAPPAAAPLQPVLARAPIIMIATAQPTIALPTPAPVLAVLEAQPSATPTPIIEEPGVESQEPHYQVLAAPPEPTVISLAAHNAANDGWCSQHPESANCAALATLIAAQP